MNDDYYAILGVSRDADQSEIKKAAKLTPITAGMKKPSRLCRLPMKPSPTQKNVACTTSVVPMLRVVAATVRSPSILVTF